MRKGMKNQKVLALVAPSRNFSFHEEGLMGLLLVLGLVQIACMFSASGPVLRHDAASASIVQMHNGTMLAKR
jgi:hypothetical protein